MIFLSRDQALSNWDRIGQLLLPAIEKSSGDMTESQVAQMVSDGHMFIAAMVEDGVIKLAAGLQTMTFPNHSVLSITLLGGEPGWTKKFADSLEPIEEFARDIGCTHIQIGCGPAEARLFSRYKPFVPVCTILRFKV